MTSSACRASWGTAELPLPDADFADFADRTGGITGERLGLDTLPLKGSDLGQLLASRGRSPRKQRSYGPRRQPFAPPVRSAKSAKSAAGSGSSVVREASRASRSEE